MYVRWKRRQGKPRWYGYTDTNGESRYVGGYERWYAYLCRNMRIDGKPRQQVVAYLGHIDERDAQLEDHPRLDIVLAVRHRFWKWALNTLDQHSLDIATRERCITALAHRVPPLTPVQTVEVEQRQKQAMAMFRAMSRHG